MPAAKINPKLKSTINLMTKACLTVLAFYLLLSHKVQMIDTRQVSLQTGETVTLKSGDTITSGPKLLKLKNGNESEPVDGKSIKLKDGMAVHLSDGRQGTLLPLSTMTTFSAIMKYLPNIDLSVFWMFVILAALTKCLGIVSSMYRWHLLLQGQGIKFPFWHILGSFLIGRFLGTFLPSTIGLDGYKLYDAARFSRRTVEATAATVIEKVLGIVGIFITFLVTLPLGISILGAKAGQIALLTVPIVVVTIVAFFLLLFYPRLVQWLIEHIPLPGKSRIDSFIHRVSNSAAAYRNKRLMLLNAAFQSFMVHFTTAAMYFFTALAIGATGASFWQVTFASTIQIFATVISPITIAGEGIREIAQYYLLRNQLGPAESIVSAALGFWAAEALTLFGGIFWWVRKKEYIPKYLFLDGKSVDIRKLREESDKEKPLLNVFSSRPPVKNKGSLIFNRIFTGVAAGVLGGVVLGLTEAVWIYSIKGAPMDIFRYSMILYAIIGLMACGAAGLLTGLLSMILRNVNRSRWTAPILLSGWISVNLLIVGRFRVFRDIFNEQRLSVAVQGEILAVAALSGLILLGVISFISRRWSHLPQGMMLLAVLMIVLASVTPLLVDAGTPEKRIDIPPVSAQLENKPNVILIMMDALRADRVGCYGYSSAKTPVMDGIASEGVRFHSAYANSSWTKPGTANIFTGLYPSGHKAFLKPDTLPDSVVTIAEVFQDAGYYTIGFPNNINIAPDFNFGQGFEEYDYLAPDYFFNASEAGSQLSYYSILRLIRERFLFESKYPQNYYQEATVVNQHALDFLDRGGVHARFFMYLHYMEPHDPYFQHPFNGRAFARVDMPNPAPAMVTELNAAYDGEVAYLDHQLGELFDALKKKNLWDNTIILLIADHGEEFYDHGGWWHGTTLYEEQIRVPMIFKLLETPPLEERVRLDKARQIDVAPTLLSLCQLLPSSEIYVGRNLFGPLDPESQENDIFAEEDHEGNIIHCLIDGPWKIITANPDNPRGLNEKELFRLDYDIHEKTNLISEELEKNVQMTADLEAAKSEAAKGNIERATKDLDKDELEKMKQLGYIE